VFFFPNTADLDFFRERSTAAREQENPEPVLLFVARLIGVKRCDLLIRAAGLLRDRGVSARVVVAGDGVERDALADLVTELGLTGVTFLGNVGTDDLPALYGGADVFVLPSDHEPWGAVVSEAMACGLPIVVSDRVASGVDLVADDDNGAVFAHGDAEGLAGVLERLLSDRARLRRMGARSSEKIESFSHARCAEAFVSAVTAAIRKGS
jgi:glycosyltransferase involved in cell wall biosynthesis